MSDPDPGPAAATAPWPLAGTAAFDVLSARTRAKLDAYFREALRRDVTDTWLARGVDWERGGFITDLDRQWRPRGAQQRMLEHQARQARSAARLARAFPSQADRWNELALHGFRFLRDAHWDRDHGGWYWMLDVRGEPLAAASKHSHGTAYAIGACIDVYRSTGESAALELADEGFRWLERALHDDEHGGYHGWARRDGTPILSSADSPGGDATSDPLGHGVGHKDINVTSDLFEMLADTHDVLDAPVAFERARELRDCIVRMMTPDGGLHYAAHPDWMAVPGLERYGYHMLTAYRLVLAAGVLGTPVDEALDRARLLMTHTLERGWQRRGGIAYAGPASAPDEMDGQPIVVRQREWWIQLEGLKVILLLAAQDDAGKRQFGPKLREHLAFIERECRDHRYGGWYKHALGDYRTRWRIASGAGLLPRIKSEVWKDCSHETDVYLTCLRLLAGVGPEAALE